MNKWISKCCGSTIWERQSGCIVDWYYNKNGEQDRDHVFEESGEEESTYYCSDCDCEVDSPREKE